jgi:hypothetical protein
MPPSITTCRQAAPACSRRRSPARGPTTLPVPATPTALPTRVSLQVLTMLVSSAAGSIEATGMLVGPGTPAETRVPAACSGGWVGGWVHAAPAALAGSFFQRSALEGSASVLCTGLLTGHMPCSPRAVQSAMMPATAAATAGDTAGEPYTARVAQTAQVHLHDTHLPDAAPTPAALSQPGVSADCWVTNRGQLWLVCRARPPAARHTGCAEAGSCGRVPCGQRHALHGIQGAWRPD